VLPPDQRAKTDEDVAHFVRKLVGDRLDERRGTLHNALARADEFASSTVAHVGGKPPSPGVPATASVLPGLSETATTWSPDARKRRLAVWVGGAVLVAGALGAIGLFEEH
jgi:hypothetical protein